MAETIDEYVEHVRSTLKRLNKAEAADLKRKRQESPSWRRNAWGSARYVSFEFRKRNPRLAAVAKSLCAGAEGRAAAAKVRFDLTANWIFHRLLAGKCEVTGLRFEMSQPGKRSNFAPSVDRKVPELGYTKGNCRVVVWGYNAAKGSGTDEDVTRIAEAVVRQKAQDDGSTSTERAVG